MKTISIIKGDDKYYSIVSASIIAKVIHDQQITFIEELVNNNPNLNQYHLLNNYGYGTLDKQYLNMDIQIFIEKLLN